jgi:hypothetical protein
MAAAREGARPRYGASPTQVQPERAPRLAAEPSRHVGLDMTSQKPSRTATNATLKTSRRFISVSCSRPGISRGGRGASRSCSMPSARGIDLIEGDQDLEGDQEHDDEFEAKRAPCIDDVGQGVGGFGDHG